MKYVPQKNKSASRLAFIWLLVGLVLFAAATVLPYRWIGQSLGIVAVVVGIQYVVRFVLPEYRYILEYKDDGGCELIVCKRTGKSDIKVCHISMSCVSEVAEWDKKTAKSDKIFNYCQNSGVKGVSVIYEDGGRVFEIILEADNSFADALRAAMACSDGDIRFAM